MGFLKVLRLRHLAILWLSQVLSAIGDRFYVIAVTWMAVKIAGSAAGIVVAAEAGSMLLFGLPGGVYAERCRSSLPAYPCADRNVTTMAPGSGGYRSGQPGRSI